MSFSWPLAFEQHAKCSKTRARAATLTLPHAKVKTPVFMPVGTQAVMKGLQPHQMENCNLILNNTYHLALNPGKDLMEYYGGSHKFMRWNKALLTDSGGFQMVSLSKLCTVTEEGVEFLSHIDSSPVFLSPEESINIQQAIGSDIMMQLDDVVSSVTTGPRVKEAMDRSIRWLDRCIAHIKSAPSRHPQNLFAIVQGGLDPALRLECCAEMSQRECPGYAIGGLSGGESKDTFWKIVKLCVENLPKNKPIYCMGVGYAEDLVVCVALGVDMFDCVFPTRTARVGNALTRRGAISLKHSIFSRDETSIESDCGCKSCLNYTRAEIHALFKSENSVACQLVTVHNVAFQLRLMEEMREAVICDRFPDFVKDFMKTFYKNRVGKAKGAAKFTGKLDHDPGKALDERGYPVWIINALKSVDITLE